MAGDCTVEGEALHGLAGRSFWTHLHRLRIPDYGILPLWLPQPASGGTKAWLHIVSMCVSAAEQQQQQQQHC
jgi:hypothetical protein